MKGSSVRLGKTGGFLYKVLSLLCYALLSERKLIMGHNRAGDRVKARKRLQRREANRLAKATAAKPAEKPKS